MSGGYKAFISSDGMEILVGNKDRDNDYLTLKVASAQDFWLHVADNSGAHVIVRNENKVKRLPKNTSPSELTSHLSQKSGLGLTSLTFFSLGTSLPPRPTLPSPPIFNLHHECILTKEEGQSGS